LGLGHVAKEARGVGATPRAVAAGTGRAAPAERVAYPTVTTANPTGLRRHLGRPYSSSRGGGSVFRSSFALLLLLATGFSVNTMKSRTSHRSRGISPCSAS